MKLLMPIFFLVSATAFARPTQINFYKDAEVRSATADELYNLASTRGCSAGYVDIGRAKDAKAVVLTNGHCTEIGRAHV